MTIRDHFPSDVEKIFAEVKSVDRDMKDRREFQHILLCVELHDMAVERDVYRWIAIQYCLSLNKDIATLNGVDFEVMVDNEANRLYKIQIERIAKTISEDISN